MRSSRVPVSVAVSWNSTREAAGGSSALPAKPHETTKRPRRVEFQVASANLGLIDVYREYAAGPGIELGAVIHPGKQPVDRD